MAATPTKLTLQLTNPDAFEEMSQPQLMQSIWSNEAKRVSLEEVAKSLVNKNDEETRRQAFRIALATLGEAAKDEDIEAEADRQYDIMSNRKAILKRDLPSAIAESRAAGSNVLPDREPIQGEAPTSQSIPSKLMNILTAPARATQGALLGAKQVYHTGAENEIMKAAMENREASPITAEIKEGLTSIPEMLRGAWKGGIEGLKATNVDYQATGNYGRGLEEQYRRVAYRAAIKRLGPEATDAYLEQTADNIYDDMVKADPDKFIIEHPDLSQVAADVLYDPMNIIPIGSVLAKGSKILANYGPKIVEASKIAGRAIKGGIAGSMIGGTASVASDIANEQANLGEGDKEGFLTNLGGMAGILAAAATKIPVLEKIINKGFVHNADLKELAEAGFQKLADTLSLSKSQAGNIASQNLQKMKSNVENLKKLTSTELDFAQELRNLNQPMTIDEIASKYGNNVAKGYQSLEDLEKIHYSKNVEAALNRRVMDDKTIMEAGRIEKGYNPLIDVSTPKESKLEEFGPNIKKTGINQLKIGAAEERKGQETGKDIAKRWAKTISKEYPKERSALELRKIAEDLSNSNMLIPTSEKNPETIQNMLNNAKVETGIEWKLIGLKSPEGIAELGTKLNASEVFARLTEVPGLKTTDKVFLAPKVAAERIENLAQIASFGESVSTYNEFMNKYVRPIQNVWRMNKTLGGGPAFILRNAVITPALDFLARGPIALDPIHHAKSLLASAALASGEESKAYKLAENITHTSFTGQKYKLTDAMKAFQEAGLARQLELHVGINQNLATETNPLKKLENINKKLYQFPFGGIKKAADISENYQHFPTFLGFLDDLSKESIAKAKRLTDEYTSNYRNMTDFEKSVMTDVFGFYGWSKFIGVRIIKSLQENPERVAFFLKTRKAAQMAIGENDQAKWEELPAYLRDHSITVLPPDKTDKQNRSVEMLYNDPYQAFAQVLQPFSSEGNIRQVSGPIAEGMVELLTGTDIYGRKVSVPQIAKNVAFGFVDRPTKAIQNMINLFLQAGQPNKAIELKVKWKAINDLTGMQFYLQNRLKNLAIQKRKGLNVLQEQLNIKE